MRKVIALALLALASSACQPQAAKTTAATAVPGAVKPRQVAVTKAVPPVPLALADSLTPEMRATLQKVNLASLFLAPEPGRGSSVLDGFFGRDPQRLSLAILQATCDSLTPGLFHVVGKARYKKQVSSFTGNLQLTRIEDYYDQSRLLTQDEKSFIQDTTKAGNGDILNARAYSAAASFQFTGHLPAVYLLNGRAMLDFWVTDQGKAGGLYPPCEGCVDNKVPSKGSELLLQGKWLDNSVERGRDFLVCRDVFFISNALIKDFGIGDRGAQANPKYAKLGWSDYWENDEWWADSPKPSLNL